MISEQTPRSLNSDYQSENEIEMNEINQPIQDPAIHFKFTPIGINTIVPETPLNDAIRSCLPIRAFILLIFVYMVASLVILIITLVVVSNWFE